MNVPLTGVGSSAAACSCMATAGLKDAHSCLGSSCGCGFSAAVAAALVEEGGGEPDLAIAAGSGGVCLHANGEPLHKIFSETFKWSFQNLPAKEVCSHAGQCMQTISNGLSRKEATYPELRRLAAGGENCARLNLASRCSTPASALSAAGLCGSVCLSAVPAACTTHIMPV